MLLPVEELFARAYFQRVLVYRRPGMGCGTQSNDMRRQVNRPVIVVFRFMVDGNSNGHRLLVAGENQRLLIDRRSLHHNTMLWKKLVMGDLIWCIITGVIVSGIEK